MTNEEIEKLVKLAKEATPGPWNAVQSLRQIVIGHEQGNTGRDYIAEIKWAPTEGEIRFEANAELIAAANPTAILSLIERVKDAEKVIQKYADMVSGELREHSSAVRYLEKYGVKND